MTQETTSTSFARAGLLGNPSDGYGGKAIALTVRNFQASVTIRPSHQLEIKPSAQEANHTAGSLDELVSRLENYGYYGGTRLIKATLQHFHSYCQDRHSLHDQNFTIEYQTNIPRSVGLAGSSAIITAALKSLSRFYEVEIPGDVLATLALETERDRLGIPAGLMDRVIQAFDGVVYMDFSAAAMHVASGVEVGQYKSLEPGDCEARLYVAWADRAAEPTEVLHNRLRERFENGDTEVREAMLQFAELAEQGRIALKAGDCDELARLIDQNFDLRASICRLPKLHHEMVVRARQAGGSAKFCGSGGAIIGTAANDETLESITTALASLGCQVIRPGIRS